MKMAYRPRMKRGISLALAISFGVSCFSTREADARQAYSSIQGNIREEAEIEPYEGGKKVGPVHDWELLCKIEGDEALKGRVVKSAEEGSLDHVFILACMNMHGKGVEKNQPAAFELFKAAANRGHSNSQNNLGFLFEEGIGTKKDLKQALTWYKKAADFNNPSALCNLGNMYEHGRGVPADENEALKLYQKSSELGNRIARQNVYGIEFEREGKYKLKGIEISKGAQPAQVDKNAKKVPAAQQMPAQQKTMTYNPTTALFRNEGTPVAQKVEAPKAENSPAPKVAAKVETAKTAPSVVAKVEAAKPVSPNDLVLNNLIAKSKASAAAKTMTAQAAATATKDKNGKPSPAVAAKAPEKSVVAETAAPSVTPEAKTAESGLSAGTPTLTAILNRLSKGTSLESAAPATEQKVAESVKTAAKEPEKIVEPKPSSVKSEELKLAEKPESSKKTEKAAKEKEKQDKHKAKEIIAEKKAEPREKPVTLLTAADTKAVTSSPVEAKKEERPAVKKEEIPVVAAVTQKVEQPAKAEQSNEKATVKPAEPKKSALDTPVVASKAPVKVETKTVATATPKTESKPAAVASKPAGPATTSSAAKKSDVLIDKGANRPIRDKWALVIGITDFQDPDIPDLQYSAKDATDFYNYLTKEANFQPDHVRLLLNEQATQRRVLSELGSKFLARVVKPDDLVVLYFSTHGSPSQLDPRGKNYLVASDSDSDDLFATGIEMQKLLDSIQGRVLTDRVLLVMDACHSGFAAPDSKGMSRLGNFKAEDLVQGSGQLVICSSLADERAWESTRYQNGVFTRKLLDGLRSKGSATSLVDAYTFARDAVGTEIKEDRPGAKQTPILKGKWDGNDLVVATPAYAPQMIPGSVAASLGTDSRNALLASAPRSTSAQRADDDDSYNSKPSNDAAPRSGVIYLDSQFFSVKGDPRTLAKELYDAIKNNPSDPELYFMRAKALIQLEDWHSAIASLSEAIQMSPNRAQYYLGRAYVNFKMGKKGIAQQDLDQARFYDHKMSNNIRFHM
jgi:TPR repeat protein